MGQREVAQIREAHFLYEQTTKAKIGYGCLEVALHALGGNGHIIDLLRKPERKKSLISDVIERQGLAINWMVGANGTTTPQEFEDLLEDKYIMDEHFPKGILTGYLCLESYPDDEEEDLDEEEIKGHAIAILPRHTMPRGIRKSLKRTHSYIVIDTNQGGLKHVDTQQLAQYAQFVEKNEGTWSIAQIKKRLR